MCIHVHVPVTLDIDVVVELNLPVTQTYLLYNYVAYCVAGAGPLDSIRTVQYTSVMFLR